jgi:phosphoribosylformylglycinamidine synthase
VSGNVSLYNQTGERPTPPSPIVLCAGTLTDLTTAVGLGLKRAGSFLVLVSGPRGGVSGSLYARTVLATPASAPPPLDLEVEAHLEELAVMAATRRWVAAAHDVSDGGLAVALAEMMLATPDGADLGAQVDLGVLECAPEEALFSESPAIVFEVMPERAAGLFHAARERALSAWPIGTVVAAPELKVMHPASGIVRWERSELAACAARPLSELWNEEVS